jgi:hypothetical protein
VEEDMSEGKFKALNTKLIEPDRTPDHVSKRGIPYWWAPEWVRSLNDGKTVSRIVPLKQGDEVNLHMVSKDGNLSYIQGSIQVEFKKWHEDRQIDYILLGMDEDDLLVPDWENNNG